MSSYSNSSLDTSWGPVPSGMRVWVMSPNKPLTTSRGSSRESGGPSMGSRRRWKSVSVWAGQQFPCTLHFSGEARLSRFQKMLFPEHICRDRSQWYKEGMCRQEYMPPRSLFKEGLATPGEAVNSLHLLSDCPSCREVSLKGMYFQGQFTSDDWWRQEYKGPFVLSQNRTILKGHLKLQIIPGAWWGCLTCTEVEPLSLIMSDSSPSFLQ